MKEKIYTLGEILRLGLLKNHKGEPYKTKSYLQHVISKIPHEKVQTVWGTGYAVSESEIEKFNSHWNQ